MSNYKGPVTYVNSSPNIEDRRFKHPRDYPDNPLPKYVDGKLNPELESAPYEETITWLDKITTK